MIYTSSRFKETASKRHLCASCYLKFVYSLSCKPGIESRSLSFLVISLLCRPPSLPPLSINHNTSHNHQLPTATIPCSLLSYSEKLDPFISASTTAQSRHGDLAGQSTSHRQPLVITLDFLQESYRASTSLRPILYVTFTAQCNPVLSAPRFFVLRSTNFELATICLDIRT